MKIVFEPLERGEGFEFKDKVVGGSIPREFIPSVEKGLKVQKEDGVLAGYPTVDFKRPPGGRQVPRRGLERADLRNRGAGLLPRSILQRALGPIILEPVMKVEVVTPDDNLGDVIGDINRRRGQIIGQLERGTAIAVEANVPLSEMFGYIGQLRGMTSGRASYTMEFSHYEPVPRNVQEEIVSGRTKAAA